MLKIIALLFLSTTLYALKLPLVPPDQDPFYVAPPDYESAPLGTILRSRPTPNKLVNLCFTFELKRSWQILYRSQNSFGEATAIVMTVMEPFNYQPSKVLSYQTFQDSANINCSPSYGFQFGAPLSTIASQLDMRFLVPALQQGYFVISSDYEGFSSSFVAGRQSGFAVLDGVRAMLNSQSITGIDPSAKVVLWGYSGGSIASGWAASLQPTYAPELKQNLLGCALGGFVTNITATAEITDGGIFAGLIPLALHGLSNEYRDFKEIINENVDPQHMNFFKQGSERCFAGGLNFFRFRRFFQGTNRTFPRGFDLLHDKTIGKIIEDNCVCHLNRTFLPQIPIFLYHGLFDEIVPISGPRHIYKQWCSWGIESLEYSEDLLTAHVGQQIIGAAAAWTWIENIFIGVKPVKGCSYIQRLNNLYFYPGVKQQIKDYFLGLEFSILDYIIGGKSFDFSSL
ncbi:hypothetical protein CANMA_005080 [Candida margitis]|uniref:uncharacterized protein n=1 Tax=Candida margitis TaxID=1775924 RepID=UPI002225FF08|nr:uncharacterized protein CANMA_005080 [Candida margitis]KAI5952204.1 hypothetical protein CANMA_005080 [Candida margitis]